ncbi:uncharacterized protein LOC120634744 [Pararge aegeria]|uniref:uncharacterized protein LOC120634744 n=1 Tax=Pararge aegeria TaxID=116150 RepID=UPI0019D0BB87|nr:uncharacterized protein LOC120634744 [Pararge aegeria]
MRNYTANFLTTQPEALQEIGRIAAKIAYYNFDWRYVTLVMFNTFQYVVALESFLSNYKQSVIVKCGKFIPRHRNAVPQYIIFGKNTESLIDTIKWLDKSNYDNSGKYIVICTSPYKKDCEESLIFVAVSQLLIINVVYLRANIINEFLAFSYDIVRPGKCINSESYTLNLTDKCALDNCFKDLYPERLYNFFKCPLIVSTFEQPPFMYLNNVTMEPSGGDGDIIKLVAKALNATLEIKTPIEGNEAGLYEHNNWTGLPIIKMPRKRPLLLIVYTWIWFCFIVKSAYQAVLIRSLKNELYESFLTDFESVLRNKLPYGGLVTLREYYIDEQEIYNKWVPLDYDDATDTLDKISNGSTDFVLAMNKEIVIEHLIENTDRHLQILPEKIVNSPTVMYFKKHSVLAQPVSHVLSISVEAGLTQLTYTRYLRHKKQIFLRPALHWTDWTGLDWTAWTGLDWTGLDWTDWTGMDWTGLHGTALDYSTALNGTELDSTQLNWTGLAWTELD